MSSAGVDRCSQNALACCSRCTSWFSLSCPPHSASCGRSLVKTLCSCAFLLIVPSLITSACENPNHGFVSSPDLRRYNSFFQWYFRPPCHPHSEQKPDDLMSKPSAGDAESCSITPLSGVNKEPREPSGAASRVLQ